MRLELNRPSRKRHTGSSPRSFHGYANFYALVKNTSWIKSKGHASYNGRSTKKKKKKKEKRKDNERELEEKQKFSFRTARKIRSTSDPTWQNSSTCTVLEVRLFDLFNCTYICMRV